MSDSELLTRHQLRGSSLLLAGRVLSMVVNLATQVLIVRYLTKSDYGAFAYALAIAGFAEPLITLGLHRGATRFLSIYDEQRDYGRLFGTIVLGLSTILSLGLAVVLLAVGLRGVLGEHGIAGPQALALLSILIVLAPVDALDGLVESVFAVLGRPMSIFVRKHVVAPGLRLGVVSLLIFSGEGVRFLAIGYVAAGAVGLVFYGAYLVVMLRRRGLLAELRATRLTIPVREVLGFAVTLLSVDLVFLFITTTSTVLLGMFAGIAAVATYQAALVPARMNYRLVTSSFTLLFTPAMSRLHARGDGAGLADLYWRTAGWIAVLSFPLFALTSAHAAPLITAVYGDEYRDAAVVLAILAVGYYVNAALGLNAQTLQIVGEVRCVLAVNLIAVVINIAVALLLIPRWGAPGAAVATSATLLGQNVLNQIGLARRVGVRLRDPATLHIYRALVVTLAVLAGAQVALSLPIAGAVALAAAASVVVVRVVRRDLVVSDTFPELHSLPLARLVVGPRPGPVSDGEVPVRGRKG